MGLKNMVAYALTRCDYVLQSSDGLGVAFGPVGEDNYIVVLSDMGGKVLKP